MSSIRQIFDDHEKKTQAAAAAGSDARAQAADAERAFVQAFERVSGIARSILQEVAQELQRSGRYAEIRGQPLKRANNGSLQPDGFPNEEIESDRMIFTIRGNPVEQTVEFVQHGWGSETA